MTSSGGSRITWKDSVRAISAFGLAGRVVATAVRVYCGVLCKVLGLSVVFTLAFASAAFADTVTNLLDDSPAGTQFEQITLNEGQSRSVPYRVIAVNNDGDAGCNIDGSEQLVADSTSDNAAVSTANPAGATLTFNGCGPNSSGVGTPPPSSTQDRSLQILGKSRGTANIILRQASGTGANTTGSGTFDYSSSGIQVIVNNVAPTANNDSYNTNEDNPLTVAAPGVLGNDTDTGNNPLTSTLVSGPSNGTLTLNANGSFVYTPNANFNGTDTFTYRANDGQASSNVATATINVAAVNDRPSANADTASTGEDQTIQIAVLSNDTDPEGNALTVTGTTQPANGTVSCTPAGTCTYNPNPNFNGEDSFTYNVSDGNGGTATARVTVSVGAANDAPVAQNNAYTVAEDGTLNVAAPGVLGNDSDPDGDTLTTRLVRGTGNGTVTLNANGSFVYTPNANFNGTDSFTYQACDSPTPQLCSEPATVNITVSPANDPPIARGNTGVVNEDGQVTVNAIANDTDVDGNQITVTAFTQPQNGTVNCTTAGSCVYTPNPNFNGSDSFTYTISDGNGGTATGTVNLTVRPVNDAPVAQNNAYTVAEDTPLTVNSPGVLGNDTDLEGNQLRALLVSGPSNGTVTLNANGSFVYTPNENFSSTDTFTYRANDDLADSNVATVTISVSGVNDPPVNTVPGGPSTAEDTALVFSAANGNRITVADPDAGGETVQVTLSVGSGSLTLGSTTGVTVTGNGSATVTVTGTVANINAALNGLRFDPAANANGTVTLTVATDDQGNTGSGGARTDTDTVQISVTAVNDAPVAQNDTATTTEDTPAVVNVRANDTTGPGEGGQTLAVTQITQAPANGTATIVQSGPDAGSVRYTPDANFNGTDTFTYRVCDNGGPQQCSVATVEVNVTGVNDAPAAQDDTRTVAEDGTLAFPASDLTANDSPGPGEGGQNLTVTAVGNATNGTVTLQNGQVVFTPNANYNGPASFDYTVCDSGQPQECSTATVDVTVTGVNDPPTARPDTATTDEDAPVVVNVRTNDSVGPANESAQTLTVANIAEPPANGTATIIQGGPDAGSVRYTPDANFNGTDTFEYRVCDSGNPQQCDTATVTVNVSAVNDPPGANDDAADAVEGGAPVAIAVLDNDTDGPDTGETLTITANTQPPAGEGTVQCTATNCTFTPNPDFFGTTSFTYTVSDGNGGTDTATVTVNVGAVNDAPVARNDARTIAEDGTLDVPAGELTDNDSPGAGEPGQTLTITSVGDAQNGTVTLQNGRVIFTPNPNYSGPASFDYTVCDSGQPQECSTATVDVTVTGVNDPPDADNDAAATNEDTSVVVDVAANDSPGPGNETGQTLTVTNVSNPANGTAAIIADGPNAGKVRYTPDGDFNGTNTFTYTVCDSGNPQRCDTATVTVTVAPQNDSPVAANDAATTDEDTPVRVPVLRNDDDTEGNALSVESFTDPNNGSVTVNADGTITYTPDTDFFGTDTFTYTVSDGNGGTDTATVTITVSPVNDPPVAQSTETATQEDTNVVIDVRDGDVPGPPNESNQTLTVNAITQAPANGTATIIQSGPNAGNVRYDPNPDFNGTDTFTYRVCDDGDPRLCDTATVTVIVGSDNDPPLIEDDAATTTEDNPVNISVLGNDSDSDGVLLPGSVNITRAPESGTVTVNADGSITYTPDPDSNGRDSFAYEACDDGDPALCDAAVVNVTVTGVNDPPEANDVEAEAVEDRPLVFPAAERLTANDSPGPNEGSQTLTVTGVGNATNGTVTLEDGQVTFVPSPNYSGPASFEYTVCDNGSPQLCDTATVNIAVTPVNDPPVADNDAATTDEDTPVVIDVLPGDTAGPGEGGQTLTVTEVTDPAHGTVTIIQSGPNAGQINYVPEPDFNGTDTFSYEVCDNGTPQFCDTATVTVNVAAANDAPVARDNSYQVREDGTLNIGTPGLLGNDEDLDDDPLTVEVVDGPENGTLTVNDDGSFSYEPDPNFNGTDFFTYQACDDGTPQLCDTATVNLTVVPVNDVPTADDGAYAVDEDGSLSVDGPGVLAGDADADGDPLAAELVQGPQNGTLTLNPDGSFTYTPDPNFNGTDTFTYQACDPSGACSEPAAVTITVDAVDDPPQIDLNGPDAGTGSAAAFVEGGGPVRVAQPDLAVADADDNAIESAVVTLTNVLDGDAESLLVDTAGTGITADYDPATGELTLTGPATKAEFAQVLSTVRYRNISQNPTTADRNVTFVVNDGEADSNTATAMVSVQAVNDAPGISLPGGELDHAENDPPSPIDPGALLDDPDTASYDGGSLTVRFAQNGATGDRLGIQNQGTGPGQIGVSGNNVTYDGTVIGTYAGGTPSTPLVVDFNANATPEAAQALLRNVTYATTSQNPDTDPRTVTFTLADGAGASSNTAAKTINVSRVNDPPVNIVPAAQTVDEDGALVFSQATGNRIIVGDQDAGTNPVSVTLGVGQGTLTLGPTPGVDVTGNGTGTVTIVGSLARVNAATNGLRYVPDPGYNGPDSLQVVTNDQGNSGAGGPLTDTDGVPITVASVNDAPAARADGPYATQEDAPLSVGPGEGLLANDEDDGPAPLTAELVGGPQNGTLTLNPDGSFVYTPDADYEGPDSFTYRACDGGTPRICSEPRTVALNVGSANDPPVADADAATTDEDAAAVIDVTEGDSPGADNEGAQVLTVTGVTAPANGTATIIAEGPDAGEVRYVPDPDFSGTDTFEYTVCDSGDPRLCDTATVTVTVEVVNDPPQARGDARTVPEDGTLELPAGALTANDSAGPANEGAQELTVVEVNNAENGTVTLQNGEVTFIPTPGYSGPAGFEYTVCDSGDPRRCDTAAVDVAVTAVNDPPVADADAYQTDEDTPLRVGVAQGVLGNDADDGPGPLTAQLRQEPENGELTLNANGSFVYTPNENFNGIDSFTYAACDGANPPLCSEPVTVTIDVDPANDQPVATGEQRTVEEDGVLNLSAADLLANDTTGGGEGGQTLSIDTVDNPRNGTVRVSNGRVIFTPDPNYNGPAGFNYAVCDNGSPRRCDTATVSINVTPVDDPPTAVRDEASTLENRPVTVNVLQNDTDPEGNGTLNPNSVEVVVGSGPSNGRATANANGTITYTPNRGFTGRDIFRYRVCDRDTPPLCNETNVVIRVTENTPLADIIVRSSAPARVTVGQRFNYTVAINNAGPDTSQDVILRSVMPPTVRFIDAPAGCRYLAGQRAVVCNLGDIGNGGRREIRIRVEAERAGDTTFRANISSDTEDPNPENNVDTEG